MSLILLLATLAVINAAPAAADPGCREGDTRPICNDDPDPPGAHDPEGTLTAVVRQINGIQVIGQAHDPSDPTSPVTVDITVDGTRVGSVTANQGQSQTFDGVVPPRAGGQVCAKVRNMGAGVDKSIGCVTKTIKVDPFGAWESTVKEGEENRVKGWVIDPDTIAPVQIDVYDESKFVGSIIADKPRPDVGDANPGYGNHHGFDALLPRHPVDGEHQVCLVMINAGPGAHSDFGCRPYTVRHLPWGAVDQVKRTGTDLRVVGWAVDDDAKTSPVTVDVYLDGKLVHNAVANQYREEVGRDLPGYGADHGYDFTLPNLIKIETGKHTVCVRARNLAAGVGADRELGCKDVTIEAPVEPPNFNIGYEDITDTTLNFRWEPDPNADLYTLTKDIGTGWVPAGSQAASSSPSYKFTGLAPGTAVCLRVVSSNDRPSEARSTQCARTYDPMLPRASNVSVIQATETSLTLQWTDNTDGEQSYQISYEVDGRVTDHEIAANPGTGVMTHTITGLKTNTQYLIKVRPFHALHLITPWQTAQGWTGGKPVITSFTGNWRQIHICDSKAISLSWKVTAATKIQIKQGDKVIQTLERNTLDLWEDTIGVGTSDGNVVYTLIAHNPSGRTASATWTIAQVAGYAVVNDVVVTNLGYHKLVARLYDLNGYFVRDIGTIAVNQRWTYQPPRCQAYDVRLFREIPAPPVTPRPGQSPPPPQPPTYQFAWNTGAVIGHDRGSVKEWLAN
ncbi:fibronectin type III domain-containing protein [Herbidospora mongoliensis]|uniref:fibronectin type III domain-containing protein n=1 Tax=Herbidospora mongoliensis TaxID=688067 RepID=UPI00082CB358|nr:fibronectin type III domain-containing protein [Herbidospora mongoliensis]